MADLNNLLTSANYSALINEIKDLITAQMKLDPQGISNIPIGSMRLNPTTKMFEKFNGTSWDALTLSEIEILQTAVAGKAESNHNHSGIYEPVFTKKTAFNKNFGTAAGTVCQGNDSRLSDARIPTSHNHDSRYYTESEINTQMAGKASTSHTHDDRYFTESEINTQMAEKANASHSHSGYLGDTSHSFNYTGYQKLSNGLIIQWAYNTYQNTTDTTKNYNFPIAFPNACLVCNIGNGNLTNSVFWNVCVAVSKTGYSVRVHYTAEHYMIAIGY